MDSQTLSTLIAAGGSLASSALGIGQGLLSGGINYSYQKRLDAKAYQRQVALLQMQQQFAERMANTAHQREVADLRKAGLNPILSATGGQGAMSPVTSAPSVSTGSKVDFDLTGGDIGAAFSSTLSALSSARLNSELADKAEADVGKIKAEAAKIRAEAEVERAKAKAVNKTESFLDGITNPQVWRDLVTDPNTWRGVKDFFTGSSSARQSVSSPRKVPVGDVVRNPERRGPYRYYDFDEKRWTNDRPRGNFVEYEKNGTPVITIKKKGR